MVDVNSGRTAVAICWRERRGNWHGVLHTRARLDGRHEVEKEVACEAPSVDDAGQRKEGASKYVSTCNLRSTSPVQMK